MRLASPFDRAPEITITALFGAIIARRCAGIAAAFAAGGKGAVSGWATIATWCVVVAGARRWAAFTASVAWANGR